MDQLPKIDTKAVREMVLNDLFAFSRIVLGLDFLYGPVHYPLCEFLQKCPKRGLVILPLGS